MITRDYDVQNDEVTVYLSGVVRKEELFDYYRTATADPDRDKKRFAIVLVDDDIRIDFDSLEMVELHRYTRPPIAGRIPRYTAVVASAGTGSLYARIFQQLMSGPRYNVRVFSDETSARNWIETMKRLG